MLGLAGAGKSTQGQRLADEFGWAWLSAGQILRDSGEFQEILARGELVDDKIVGRMILAAVNAQEQAGRKVILDGYPRGEEQATTFVNSPELMQKVEAIFCLEAPRAELEKRLLKRGRADDTKEAIEKRLDDGDYLVGKVITILQAAGCQVVPVDGTGTPDEVQVRLMAEVEKIN